MALTHEMAGLAPPPEKWPSLLRRPANPDNEFESFPRAVFEQRVVKFKSMFGMQIFMHDPDGVRRVLLDNAANYPKDELSDRIFTAMFGEGLLSAAPEKWQRHRKIMAPAFAPSSVASYAPAMVSACQAFVDRWSSLNDPDIDMAVEMKALTLQIICDTVFGSGAAELIELAGPALGFADDALNFGIMDMLPIIGPMRVKAKQNKLHKTFGALDGAIYRMIAEREANLTAAPKDLLTRLIVAREAEDGPRLTAQEVRDEIITIFEAGHETTAVAMTFTWYLLSQHPAVEAKLHAELDAVLAGRAPTVEDLPKLPYTRQVIEESMRLYPPAPGVTGRRAIAADEVCGLKVNPGDRIAITPWVLHRHHTLWDEPLRFDPDRFSPERSRNRPRFAYMPFGAGPRICIGMGLAMTEATLILATLAQSFEARLQTPQDVKLLSRITLSPKGGLKMRLQRRAATAASA